MLTGKTPDPPRQLTLDLPARTAFGREDFLVSSSNVAAFDFIGSGFAVTDDQVAAGKGCDGGAHFAAKGVFAGVAGSVAEPDFAPRVVGGEGLEHREDRG